MNKYTFYWLDGTREVLEGKSESDAANRAGYGHGAISALDFVAKGENNEYVWNNNKWVKK
jgi:hypothetical protein